MATVLIASLGDSPVVVTAMFDSLEQEVGRIDQVEVIYPKEGLPLIGYEDLIRKPLQQKCNVEPIPLDSEDVSGEDAAYDFLRKLYQQLTTHQKKENIVYLSLAGGRKSMATLMALLAPLFPCVKGLYHILDKDEGKNGDHFWSTTRLHVLAEVDRQRHLFPPHERVTLIRVPFGEKQRPSAVVKSLLNTITDEQLDELWERDPEQARMMTYYRQLAISGGRGKIIQVELTEDVIKQYREMRQHDVAHAENFAICFDQMHFAWNLNTHSHDIKAYKGLHFHYYKRHRTVERAVFHTEPIDIKANPDADIKRVVVSALPIEVEGKYPKLEEIVSELRFPQETEKLEDILPQEYGESKELILIIPLGTSPMVATQLYQLYKDRGNTVHSVILVHTQHDDVCDSVEIACDAFEREGVAYKPIILKGYNDIDTPEACVAYQALLEQTIQDIRQQNPSCQIELTISGGRKGMAALATFAAQKQGIRRIVHTVIHERMNDKVSEETTIKELKNLARTNDKKKRDDRLFLRAYKDKDAFVLFKIPVIPVQKG